jgi:hypothetical protein
VCTLGVEIHTGWVAVLALGGTAGKPIVTARTTLELVRREPPEVAFAYHAAVDHPDPAALIEEMRAIAVRRAEEGLRALLAHVADVAEPVTALGIAAPKRKLPALDAILGSHALLHTAEGELFRGALVEGARRNGLAAVEIDSRDLEARASDVAGDVEAWLAALGKAAGRPWSKDQKRAALFALLAADRTNGR